MSAVWERIGPQLTWFGDEFPDEALAEANLHRDEIAPLLVAELERIASDPAPARDPQYALFLCAMHLLAQWRDVRGFEPLLRVARLPGKALDDIFGDLIAETFDRCLASLCPGDLGPLVALAADRGASLWARVAGIEAMNIRVLEGDAAHGDAIDVLRQLGERLAERVRAIDGAEEDWEVLAWVVAAASELGPGPMLDTIRGWFRERLIHEGIVDLASVERDARTDPAVLREQGLRRGGYIQDVAHEIRQWEAYGPPGEFAFETTGPVHAPTRWNFGMPHRRDTPKVGRNDPCPCGSGKKYKKCCGAG